MSIDVRPPIAISPCIRRQHSKARKQARSREEPPAQELHIRIELVLGTATGLCPQGGHRCTASCLAIGREKKSQL
eukprot:1146583-Pelagomonas_calceolata.AAC.3